MKSFASTLIICIAGLFCAPTSASAQWGGGFVPVPQPVFDVEYQVWGKDPRPLWVWDIVVTHPDGSTSVDGGHASEYDAHYRLFRMVEWGMIHPEDEVSVARRRAERSFQLMGTYDTRTQAEAIANFIEAFGWESDVRRVITVAWP